MADPTWADILVLFTEPYWISPPDDAIEKANHWVERMITRKSMDLRNYTVVKANITNIITHTSAGTMPPPPQSGEHKDRFPDKAVELLQTWRNIGCPEFEE